MPTFQFDVIAANGVAIDVTNDVLTGSRITKFTREPSVIHTSMRNKQVEFNT